MFSRSFLLGLGMGSSVLVSSVAQACAPAPLGDTKLYLRGGFNGWASFDSAAFFYRCDAYYLDVNLIGQQEFKIGDATWSPTSTFGGNTHALMQSGAPAALARGAAGATPPGNLRFKFTGRHTVRLAMHDGAPQLTIGPRSAPAAGAGSTGDPLALSLAHDSRALADKSPFGSAPAGTSVRFRLNALPQVPPAARATLVLELRKLEGNQEVLDYSAVARLPMTAGSGGWSAEHRFAEPGVYGYYFEIESGGAVHIYQNNENPVYWTREAGSNGRGELAPAGQKAQQVRRFRQTIHAASFSVPAWARDAVYYYIFPERFRNGDKRNDPRPGKGIELHANWLDQPYRPGSGDGSDQRANNDFFGGDLRGVTDKLDYIRALGANTVYMTPVFRAASNHKYDTADYRNIDPAFGTNADYQRLLREAGKRGMRVIADASFNHTGSDSIYFDRYARHPGVGAFDGGRVRAASPYASWYRFDPKQSDPDRQYAGWGGTTDLPELDKHAASWRAFAYGAPDSITRLWLQRGAAGWRMDVAPWVPDGFWREWRKVVKAERSDAIAIAETWFESSKYFLGDTFDTTMNYIFRNAVLDYAAGLDARVAYENMELMRETYPPQAFYALMNLLSTHDQARSLHVLADGDSGAAATTLARRRYRLAVLFQMMYPGAPAIYYGDEVGLSGGDDPANRAAYPWADQGGKPDTALLAEFKTLTGMRERHPVLRHGSIDAPVHIDQNVIVLLRRSGSDWAICATNNADAPRTVSIALPPQAPRAFKDALSGAALSLQDGRATLTLPALYGSVLVGTTEGK